MGAPPSFLDKLCSILGEAELAEHISWNQEGDGIVIRKIEQFASDVLPRYYKHSNYQSFVRQLNIYGFHKTKHDEFLCEFKQPHFRRGQRHLLGLIRRKGQGTASAAKQRDRNLVTDETKGMMERVGVDMKHMCNRVAHLEAEMGVMNQRHETLKLENQALWRLILLGGSEGLRQKAIDALQRNPSEMTEMILFRHQEEEAKKNGQDVRGPVPLVQPMAAASGPAGWTGINGASFANGVAAALTNNNNSNQEHQHNNNSNGTDNELRDSTSNPPLPLHATGAGAGGSYPGSLNASIAGEPPGHGARGQASAPPAGLWGWDAATAGGGISNGWGIRGLQEPGRPPIAGSSSGGGQMVAALPSSRAGRGGESMNGNGRQGGNDGNADARLQSAGLDGGMARPRGRGRRRMTEGVGEGTAASKRRMLGGQE